MNQKFSLNSAIKILTYNIGDCCYGTNDKYKYVLGKQFDSFYKAPKTQVEENLNGVINIIESGNYDICLLQEVNALTPVNYYINANKKITEYFKDYQSCFQSNSNILNIVNNGNLTLSKHSTSFEQHKIPIRGKGFVNNLAYVHKALTIARIPIEDTKSNLVIYNIHLTPFSRNLDVKRAQFKYILALAKAEYEKGNYCVIGGDWNTGLDDIPFEKEIKEVLNDNIWEFICVDGITRSAHKKDRLDTSTLDGFYFSPNITGNIKSLENFKYSDHSPVELLITLK